MERKHKVIIRDRKEFTGYEIEAIERIAGSEDFEGTVQDMLDTLAGSGELIRVKLEWGYNRTAPADTFWGEGVDIMIDAYVLDGDYIYWYAFTTFAQVCRICDSDDRRALAYKTWREI